MFPTSLNFSLSEITLTPYIPVPETNGEEWDRLEPSSALDALVELVLHGEYNGLDSDKRLRESLELRAAAAGVFEVIFLVICRCMVLMPLADRTLFAETTSG